MKNILSPQYNAREAVTLAGSLNVKTIDEIKNRIIALSNGKNKKSSINLIADIPDVVSLQIPAAVQLDIIGNGYSLNANFIIDGEVSVSGAILSGTFKGTGKASFTSCEFTRNSFLISAVDGWSFSDCVFPNTIGTATLTNVVLRGRAKTGIETEISVGTLQNCDIELVGGINSTSPVNSLITLNGDWTNLGSLGAGTNIIARNIILPMGGGTALPPNADYGDITVTGTGNVWTIDNFAVTDSKFRVSSALSLVGRSANFGGIVGDITTTAGSGAVLRESGSTLGFGTLATAGIANNAVTFAKMQNLNSNVLVGNSGAAGLPEEITMNATMEILGGSLQRAALTGDVTAPAGSNTTTIANGVVTDAKLRNSAALSILGRFTNTSGTIADISAVANSNSVLRENGSGQIGWGTINTANITDDAVTDAKLRNSAALSVIGRSTNTSGDTADIAAAADGHVLRRSGTTIGFGNIPESSVTNLVVDLAARVVGPASADDNAITRYDGTTGKLIQNSSVTLDDNGLFAWAASTNGQMDCDKTITLNSDKLATNTDLLSIQRNGVATATVRAAGELVVGRTSANILLSDHLKTNRFGWDSDATTYITHPNTGSFLDVYSAGTLTARFSDYQILANQDDPTTPAYSFQEAVNTGVTLNSALDKLLLVNNSETIASVDADGFQVTSNAGLLGATGNAFINQFAAGAAVYSFFGDKTTGMLRTAANEIGWNCGGTTQMILTANELNVLGNVKRNTTSSTADANFVVNSTNIGIASWVASFTAARTLQVSNVIAGRSIKILMRNTNATARVITIQASATTSGYANVICTGNTAGAASVSTVSLAATSGTAIIEIFATAGGIFGRLG